MTRLRLFPASMAFWVGTLIGAGVLASACTDATPSRRDGDTTLRRNGRIAFAHGLGEDSAIFTMEADGSSKTRVVGTKGGRAPDWSSDGTMIVFNRGPVGGFDSGIFIVKPPDGSFRRITRNKRTADAFARWSPDATRIAYARGFFKKQFGPETWDLYVMDSDGTDQTNLTQTSSHDLFPPWSPDGSEIAFASDRSGRSEIYVMDFDGNLTRLTHHDLVDTLPVWSPDGKHIAFVSNRDGTTEIYLMNADGTNQMNLTNNEAEDIYPAWSPDGTWIVFASTRDGNSEIYVMDADGGNPRRLTNDHADDLEPSWQPIPQ